MGGLDLKKSALGVDTSLAEMTFNQQKKVVQLVAALLGFKRIREFALLFPETPFQRILLRLYAENGESFDSIASAVNQLNGIDRGQPIKRTAYKQRVSLSKSRPVSQ